MVETSRRREIEDAASSLFHEHGYSGTSVRDIARAVDIQGASLYAHVASKQEVLWSIVERTASRFEAAADTVELATSTGDVTLRDQGDCTQTDRVFLADHRLDELFAKARVEGRCCDCGGIGHLTSLDGIWPSRRDSVETG